MTKTLTASIAIMTLAIATAAVPTAADARCPGCVGEPPQLLPASVLMVQFELTPTARKTTPDHCG